MSPRLSGGFLDEWQNLPRWMIGFGLGRFDRASTCIRDLRVSKLCSARQLADAAPQRFQWHIGLAPVILFQIVGDCLPVGLIDRSAHGADHLGDFGIPLRGTEEW